MVRSRSHFQLHIRIGKNEVELRGAREEVISTLDDLNGIIEKISEAFKVYQHNKNWNVIYLKAQHSTKNFLTIPRTTKCSEAVVSLLSTEWGRTPRTLSELREAMEANAVFYPKTTLSGVLIWLVKKGKIRRWKDKKRGYLYVFNESEKG